MVLLSLDANFLSFSNFIIGVSPALHSLRHGHLMKISKTLLTQPGLYEYMGNGEPVLNRNPG